MMQRRIGQADKVFLLQRGRARAGAECPPSAHAGPDWNRFNGAAPARARNEAASSGIIWPGVWLQRGRARAGAECSIFDRWRARSCTRLQRGRARAGAE